LASKFKPIKLLSNPLTTLTICLTQDWMTCVLGFEVRCPKYIYPVCVSYDHSHYKGIILITDDFERWSRIFNTWIHKNLKAQTKVTLQYSVM